MGTKTCPYCHEENREDVWVCRFCNRKIEEPKKTKKCPHCAGEAPFELTVCPYCAKPMVIQNTALMVIGLLLGVIVFGVFVAFWMWTRQ